jgi:hypothetical protein
VRKTHGDAVDYHVTNAWMSEGDDRGLLLRQPTREVDSNLIVEIPEDTGIGDGRGRRDLGPGVDVEPSG